MDVFLHFLCRVSLLLCLSCSDERPSRSPSIAENFKEAGSLNEVFAYLDDPVFRRDTLETSLTNPLNQYSQIRLAKYTEERWGALPIFNPRVRKVTPWDIGGSLPKPDFTWRALDVEGDVNEQSLLRLGFLTFTSYPAQLESAFSAVIADGTKLSELGLWQTDDWVGGLLWVELPGGVIPALTCATCHASVDANGTLVHGLPNYAFDLGRTLDEVHQIKVGNGEWGKGRVDISQDGVRNPTVIADLRAVAYQTVLQRAATIKNSPTAVAIRLETNGILMTGGTMRPPRQAMIATAHFLFSLKDTLPEPKKGPGQKVFDRECASCHQPFGFSGPPTSITEVGTDPAVGISPYRETGAYQTTSLRGVGDRKMLTATGAFTSVEEMLSKDRTTPGHRYGMSLSDKERADLIDFLHGL